MKTFEKSFIKKKPLRKASAKAQSAMEYLMTYGWAILIISVVLAALFQLGVFNANNFAPKAPPGACQVFRPNGPGTTSFINLEGVCSGELPQYVASFGTAPAYVLISNDSYLPVGASASRSITAWVYLTTIPNGPLDTWGGTIFTQPRKNSGTTLDVCGSFNLLINNWNNPFLHKCINDIDFGVPFKENAWEFIAVIYNNASDTMTFYLNGQGTTIGNDGMWAASQNLTIGGWDDYAPTMSGEISNFQVYNTPLSANDIQALYQEGIGGAPINLQNLVGWWPLNGNANDYSGNGNNGQTNNVNFVSNWYSGYTPP